MSSDSRRRDLPNNGHAPLSEEEQYLRHVATSEARASVSLEGFATPPELDTIDARYVAGELNDEEFENEYFAYLFGRDEIASQRLDS